MPSPKDAEFCAELNALREKVAALERQLAASQQAKAIATAVAQVGKELTESLNVGQASQQIVTTLLWLFRVRRTVLFLRDPTLDMLVCVATAGEGDPGMWLGKGLPAGVGIAGRAVAEDRALWSADLLADPQLALPEFSPDHVKEDDVRSAVGVPLTARGVVVGAVVLTDDVGRTFSQDDLQILTAFADQAALALENAQLFHSEQEQRRQLETVRSVSEEIARELDLTPLLQLITRRAAELVGVRSGVLFLWDEATQLLTPQTWDSRGEWVKEASIGLDEGVAGTVARRREGMIVNAYRNPPYAHPLFPDRTEMTAVIAEPLLHQDRLLGVLAMSNEATGRSFTEEDHQILALFVTHAATAIENARLFVELNESYRSLQEAQDELIRSEKLRALGQMAAGIAHDLNNILAAILGQVELLRFQVTDPPVRSAMDILETAATDGAQVVSRLQDFARQRTQSPLVPMNLAKAIQEAMEITRPRWRDEPRQQGRIIEVRTSLEGIPLVLGHPPEVREAVTNLILNAVDAMPSGGVLSLVANRVQKTAGQPASAPAPPETHIVQGTNGANEWVELLVTDSGSGMSEEICRRILEPFFTTKGVHATGLGLSVVYGIMERHGGRIQIASAPGQGTTITLRFQAAPQPAKEQPGERSLPGSPCRLLLIDDDSNVREAIGALLRAVGHQVIEADGGRNGIAQLDSSPLDVVLTDLGMPEVSGWDVARAAKARNPALPVVLLTGWGDQATAQAGERGLVDRVLAKPFRLDALLQVIGEVTGDRPPACHDQVKTKA